MNPEPFLFRYASVGVISTRVITNKTANKTEVLRIVACAVASRSTQGKGSRRGGDLGVSKLVRFHFRASSVADPWVLVCKMLAASRFAAVSRSAAAGKAISISNASRSSWAVKSIKPTFSNTFKVAEKFSGLFFFFLKRQFLITSSSQLPAFLLVMLLHLLTSKMM